MSAGGWFMMILSWGFIIGLSAFCMKRFLQLRNSQAKHIKPILDIDTGDLDDSDSSTEK